MMNITPKPARERLLAIARRAMIERGFLPDFSPEALEEAGRASLPAPEPSLRDLRSHMAIVPQDVLLFGGTVAENIAYGRPGASQAEVEVCARSARHHQHDVGLYPRSKFPHAPRAALDGSHLAQ